MKTQASPQLAKTLIPAARCRIEIAPVSFREAPPDVVLHVDCRIKNIASMALESAPPTPIHVSYKWYDTKSNTQLPGEGLRTALLGPVLGGRAVQQKIQIRTPSRPGRYLLRVTLVQEHVCWFDDADSTNGTDRIIDIS